MSPITASIREASAALAPVTLGEASGSSGHAREAATSGIRSVQDQPLVEDQEINAVRVSNARSRRIEHLVSSHYRLVWRFAQRLGLQPADAEDATSNVMLIASKRIDDIQEHAERSFLISTTRFVVMKMRKASKRRPEFVERELSELPTDRTGVDEVTDQRRSLDQLDRVLLSLPEDLRTVFILFEIEGFSQSEIGITLGIPQGTVASRIRRAKVQFLKVATQLKFIPRGAL
jgi:RNA polymerase sigma-70 factor (ECF subfamily)